MISFELVTLNGIKFAQEVYEVVLPTPEGYIAIFKNHAPLVSIAVPGVISIRHKANEPDDLMEHFASNGGVIEVLDNKIRVLADGADHEAEINEEEIKKALERAQQLKQNAKDQVSLDEAQSMIDRQAVRLKVSDLRRHRKRSR